MARGRELDANTARHPLRRQLESRLCHEPAYSGAEVDEHRRLRLVGPHRLEESACPTRRDLAVGRGPPARGATACLGASARLLVDLRLLLLVQQEACVVRPVGGEQRVHLQCVVGLRGGHRAVDSVEQVEERHVVVAALRRRLDELAQPRDETAIDLRCQLGHSSVGAWAEAGRLGRGVGWQGCGRA
eukprot:scaffold2774_cov87-Phaeocystis_antarctica.AAC.6